MLVYVSSFRCFLKFNITDALVKIFFDDQSLLLFLQAIVIKAEIQVELEVVTEEGRELAQMA